jgi:hypothetical protein
MRDGGQADIHRRVNPGTWKYRGYEVTLYRSSADDLLPITVILETDDEPDRAPSFIDMGAATTPSEVDEVD